MQREKYNHMDILETVPTSKVWDIQTTRDREIYKNNPTGTEMQPN